MMKFMKWLKKDFLNNMTLFMTINLLILIILVIIDFRNEKTVNLILRNRIVIVIFLLIMMLELIIIFILRKFPMESKKNEDEINHYYNMISTDSSKLTAKQNDIAKQIMSIQWQIEERKNQTKRTKEQEQELAKLNQLLYELSHTYENNYIKKEYINLKNSEPTISNLRVSEYKEKDDEPTNNEPAPVGSFDALKLMAVNMKEISDYFRINKRQATLSFYITLSSFVVGISLIIFAAVKVLFFDIGFAAAIIPAIGGTVTEIIAGITLVMYKHTLSQLNLYYESLHSNERFLSTINLVDKISVERKDDMYFEIIRSCLNPDSPK